MIWAGKTDFLLVATLLKGVLDVTTAAISVYLMKADGTKKEEIHFQKYFHHIPAQFNYQSCC